MHYTAPSIAYIGLGSNLQEPLRQVTDALCEIDNIPETSVLKVSHWYQSKAVGPGEQPDYINGVAKIETRLEASKLLGELQRIEEHHDRKRIVRWGARTLDLDILLFGDLQIDTAVLTIPHPRLQERNFVLHPLADIDPQLILPGGEHLQTLLANVSLQGIVRLADTRTASESRHP